MATKKSNFDPVELQINFSEMEKALLEHWYKDGIVNKYLKKNSKSKKYFSFQDGPITANNPMGVHHAWGRTYKDLWQRYKNMQGFKERFQNGFDAQGLWVEVEVEKDLGFKTKKDIEDFGVAEFVQKCKERVMKYSQIQTEQSKRLGYFMDWDHSYYTMSDENNYMIWHFLKVCHENGWLYKGHESVPWCPRCQTAISQHEMLTEDYKVVTHKSIYFELPIEGREREFLLVWTTTPWTLPANIAVAVDAKLDYSLVEGDTKDKYWLANEAVSRVFGKDAKILKTERGDKLVGLKYKWAFDHLPAVKKAKEESELFHTVIATDDRIMPITTSEGTGMVHTAVSAGTEDYKLGKKLGLPMIPVIEDDATYLPGLGEFTGQNAKENPEVILDYLTEEDKKEGVDWTFSVEDYTHKYPGCWRCKTELVWKVTDEWYIAMDRPSLKTSDGVTSKSKLTLRERMKKVAKSIDWVPEFGLKRELDWLDNMHDWLISKKNRYWGLCLPIWECDKCKSFDVVGGKDELQKRAVAGWDEFEGKSPHKPQVDGIVLKCDKCDSTMHRIEPVGNPWLDAGIVTYSTISENNDGVPLYKKDKKEWKNWFPADFITESFPGQFKNWFYSMIAMSTVLEDERPYKKVLGFATLFDETGRAMHKSWGNAIEFNEGADKIGVDVMRWMYARQNPSDNLLFGYNIADEVRRQFHLKLWNVYNYFVTYANNYGWEFDAKANASENLLDKWILARLKETVQMTTDSLEKFEAYKATSVLENFLNDLSNWYIRRSRGRVTDPDTDDLNRSDFFQTTYIVLHTLSLVLAPFIPFMSEVIYTNLTNNESVHLEDWPEVTKLTREEERLISEMAIVREISEIGHSLRKAKGVSLRHPLLAVEIKRNRIDPEINLDYLLIEELNVKNVKATDKHKSLEVDFDFNITPELEEEAKARDLVRSIQNERKNLGVAIDDYVNVVAPWLPSDKKLLHYVTKKTVSKSLSKGEFSVKKA